MRRARETDREKINAWLYRKKEINLFFIGDIANSGFESKDQKVWLDEDEKGIHALYLLWHSSLDIQSYEGRIDEAFLEELRRKHRIVSIAGERHLIEPLKLEGLPVHTDCRFAALHRMQGDPVTRDAVFLGEEDAEEIAELLKKSFGENAGSASIIQRTMQEGSGRYVGVLVNGKVVSTASSSAECDGLAMAVCVCTDPAYRRRGYASECIAFLCENLLAEKKTPCLFYENPEAARIYKKLGFEDIGQWSIRQK
jgi:predicted GNAT family acetyltransferase